MFRLFGRYVPIGQAEQELLKRKREKGVNSLIRAGAFILLSLIFFLGGSLVLTPLIQLHALR